MAEINIFMVGGRRCGKTSILAAMKENMDDVTRGTQLNFSVKMTPNSYLLLDKTSELTLKFRDGEKKKIFVVDDNPTVSQETYQFNLGINGKSNKVLLNFHDVPGEWFRDGLHDDEIKELIEKSQVIVIAIDSVHLMENMDDTLGYGENHNRYNYAQYIKAYFQNHFTAENLQERLILFVPLKCEKYFNRDAQAAYGNIPYKKNLISAVKKGYGDLFSFFSCDALKDVCTVAIAPILTVGGIEFFDFKKTDTGNLASRFTMSPNKDLQKYNPQYCYIPTLYTILFALKQNKMVAKADPEGFFAKLFTKISGFFSSPEGLKVEEEMQTLKQKIITDPERGFEIVQNPLGL